MAWCTAEQQEQQQQQEEKQPEEQKTEEQQQEQQKPAEEQQPEEQKPEEQQQQEEQKPEEQKPEEQKPEEQKPEEQKPEDEPKEEQKPEEQKPEEQKPEDEPKEEQKPEEQKPADQPQEDQKEGEQKQEEEVKEEQQPKAEGTQGRLSLHADWLYFHSPVLTHPLPVALLSSHESFYGFGSSVMPSLTTTVCVIKFIFFRLWLPLWCLHSQTLRAAFNHLQMILYIIAHAALMNWKRVNFVTVSMFQYILLTFYQCILGENGND